MTAVVIGGGFSGALTAAHLAARGIATTVIEPHALGRGVAYADRIPTLLLNTPSGAMSALPDAPDHFVDWLARRGTRPTFAPRTWYGEYVAETATALGGANFEHARARATAVLPTGRGFTVTCDDGRRLGARAVVLALGNAPPRTLADGPNYLGDPYGAALAIEHDEPVAMLGTGLTALDVIVTLRARGHRGAIVAVSRRGLVSAAHDLRPCPSITVPRELARKPRLRTLLAWWRSRIVRDVPEVALVAALRPLLSVIWRRLPACDRARFARHVRPRWDVLRHRAPPVVRAIVDDCRADGSLEVVAGRLVASERAGDLVRCTFATATGAVTRKVRWLVNCTGPERDVRRQSSSLVRSLLHAGMIDPDPLAVGVSTGAHGELAHAGAYAVGPWRAADLWESTAVPELRVQAADTADAIARQLAARVA